MDTTKPRRLSAVIDEFIESLPDGAVSLDHVLIGFHERGFGLLLFFFALPMGLPIPVPPGVNIILAMPLILLTAQQAMGFHAPWFPQFMRVKSMQKTRVASLLSTANAIVKKVEWVLRPRLSWVTHGVCAHVIGLAGLVMALSICVPFPLTNTVPSFGIALMAAGVLMRDGLAVLGGMIVGLAWVCALLLVGQAGLRALLNMMGL